MEIKPNNIFALGRRMECYRNFGEIDKALLDANELLKINPDCFMTLSVR
ncbi:29375_t:CDS:1, partial [Gigaspora margarita]